MKLKDAIAKISLDQETNKCYDNPVSEDEDEDIQQTPELVFVYLDEAIPQKWSYLPRAGRYFFNTEVNK